MLNKTVNVSPASAPAAGAADAAVLGWAESDAGGFALAAGIEGSGWLGLSPAAADEGGAAAVVVELASAAALESAGWASTEGSGREDRVASQTPIAATAAPPAT
jgi:hypothetical protein